MDNSEKSLEQRVEELEQKVEKLRQHISVSKPEENDTLVVDHEEERVSTAKELPKVPSNLKQFDFGENWLNRIGIGLLLLGVIFLFKYSIDQGWLIPPIRSLIGLGIGLALFIPGLQMKESTVPMKQLLLGGGIAVFYITGFATFQLYDFVAAPVMWIFMVVVTLLALSLSLQQNQAILSVVGILGGIGTPFMLYTDAGSLVSLMAYTTLVLGGGAAIYLFRGWKSLLWTMIGGAAAVLIAAYFDDLMNISGQSLTDRWALQIGVIIYLALLWVVPVVRRLLKYRNPDRWSDPAEQGSSAQSEKQLVYQNRVHVSAVSLLLPVLAFIYSMSLWELTPEAWGVIAMAVSLILGYVYLPLKSEGLGRLASTHGFVALIFLTASFFLLVEGRLLFIILAFEALGLRFIVHKTEDNILTLASHVLFGIVFVWLFNSFSTIETEALAVLNLDALTNLLIILIGGLAAPYWMHNKTAALTYRLVAHIAVLGWLFSEFSSLQNGQAYVSVGWCLYALVILILGFVKENRWLRLTGMATVFLVVGKLFLVDLAQLQAIWRILLFIGFGALFLLISYYVQQKFILEE